MDARITVYGAAYDAPKKRYRGAIISIDGVTLRLASPTTIPLGSLVKVAFENLLYMGDVCECLPESGAFHVVLAIDRALNDVAAARVLALRFEMTPIDEDTD